MMIRRTEWIRNSGFFEDYHWDSGLHDFARINVIYGGNGGGKTSLARAFDALRTTVDGAANVSLLVEDGDAGHSTGGNPDPIFDRILVFGDDYVERSHRFHEGSPSMDAVLTLGERTSEAEARLEELGSLIEAKEGERDSAKRERDTASSSLEATYRGISETVVSDLSLVNDYRSRTAYSLATVKDRFARSHGEWALLSEEELAANKQIVNGGNASPIASGAYSLEVASRLSEDAATALATTPVTIVLNTLASNPHSSSWVQTGQHLHEGAGTCIFCGSPLTDARKQDIELHFSHEVANLQSRLTALTQELDDLKRELTAIRIRIPDRGLYFANLQDARDAAAQTIQDQATALEEWIDELRDRLEQKQANVLVVIESSVADAPQVDGSILASLRDQQNSRVDEHDEIVKAAGLVVERHHLKAQEENVSGLNGSFTANEQGRSNAVTALSTLREEVASLQNVDGDPTPSAQVLTTEVRRLLGRNELKFEALDGRYVVTRDGTPATGLSVGERTAITLIHFLEDVARFDRSRGKPIVVIDDPVSSLDNNVFMGVSTNIWSETLTKDHAAQLILLTHNFDLFRQWDIQIENLHKRRDLEVAFSAQFYELKSHHVTTVGRTRRVPFLASWPPSNAARKKVRSNYHHSFIALAEVKVKLDEDDSLENRLDAQLVLPNVIRRVLESFLAFKRPEWVGDLTGAMRNATQLLVDAGYEGDADALRLRLTRYAHSYSHSETPETDETAEPEEIRSAIVAVFTFMNVIDEKHFVGLCSVAGFDPAALLDGAED